MSQRRPQQLSWKQEKAKRETQRSRESGVDAALAALTLKKKAKQKQKRRPIVAEPSSGSDDSDELSSDAGGEMKKGGESGAAGSEAKEIALEAKEKAASEGEESEEGEGEEEEEEEKEPEFATPEEEIAWFLESKAVRYAPLHTNESEEDGKASTVDASAFRPVLRFSDLRSFDLPAVLIAAASEGFSRPTPVQSACWPVAFAGRDVIGIARTGSGKTLAFLLPALANLLLHRKTRPQTASGSGGNEEEEEAEGSSEESEIRPCAPPVLVVAPTRELALQIAKVATSLTASVGLGCFSAVGGHSLEAQRARLLTTPVHCLVGTTGRICALLRDGCLSLGSVLTLVLDEADRLLDLGFEEEINAICAELPRARSTFLFSATWPPHVQAMAGRVVKRDAVCVRVGGLTLKAAESVTQIVEVVTKRSGAREKRLAELIRQYAPSPTALLIVFCLYKREAASTSEWLGRHGIKAHYLHGDMTQAQRRETLDRFRAGNPPILVATDVAARGLDVPNITHVINFSMGLSVEAYVHRVGRTGRAGRQGVAHTFFTEYDRPHAADLVAILQEGKQPVPEPLLEIARYGYGGGLGPRKRATKAAGRGGRGRPDLRVGGDRAFASARQEEEDEEAGGAGWSWGGSDDEEERPGRAKGGGGGGSRRQGQGHHGKGKRRGGGAGRGRR